MTRAGAIASAGQTLNLIWRLSRRSCGAPLLFRPSSDTLTHFSLPLGQFALCFKSATWFDLIGIVASGSLVKVPLQPCDMGTRVGHKSLIHFTFFSSPPSPPLQTSLIAAIYRCATRLPRGCGNTTRRVLPYDVMIVCCEFVVSASESKVKKRKEKLKKSRRKTKANKSKLQSCLSGCCSGRERGRERQRERTAAAVRLC